MIDEETSMLLYHLLLQNPAFRIYILSRTDSETLILPILKLINDLIDPKSAINYPHLYTLLLTLLILSTDDEFVDGIQRVHINPTPIWFTDRVVRNVSLGGLVVLVLVRVVSVNLSQGCDARVHNTVTGTLANVCVRSFAVDSAVAQRIVMYAIRTLIG
jgi:hypothetical protein